MNDGGVPLDGIVAGHRGRRDQHRDRQRGFTLPLLCAAAALLASGCESGSAAAQDTAASSSARTTLTLMPVSPLPKALKKLRPDGNLGMPRGWNIDGSGVVRSGKRLVFLAVPPASASTGTSTEETWVVDTGTARVRRFAQVTAGWSPGTAVLGGGWLLRVESRQLDGTACGDKASQTSDCYSWRLYGQQVTSGRPRLLAQSAHAGHQSLVPHPLADGGSFVWEQGLTGGKAGLMRWTPGAAGPARLLTRSTTGQLDLDGGTLYLTEGKLSADGGTSSRTTYRVGLRQRSAVAERVAAFTGGGGFAIHGGRIAYFPRPADETGRIRVLTIGGRSAPVDVGKAVNGFYTLDWITPNRLVTWSVSGYALDDLRHPAASAVFSPDAVGLGVPRGSDGTLYVAYQFAPSRGVKPTVLAWRNFAS
ncbi:hypothetical protein [Streptomyces hyaluromycini]|uniref:hypothetical protein n=1 Tax=Streptomyces hyaluromycini TaxID=1377993 RepID=UPI000B5D0736|nr:hypothetical protein [Streptomyces hyaluromycini]